MRILTYNIRHGLGMDGRIDLARVAGLIRDVDADIVFLQELDDHLPRSGFQSQAAEIARLSGLPTLFQRTIDMRVVGYGIAVATRYAVEEVRRHRLPSRGEPRGFLEVRLATPIGPVSAHCTHLGLSGEERVVQAEAIAARVRELDGTVVLGGDFNETAEGAAIAALLRQTGLSDAWPGGPPTFPTDKPTSRIDMVLHSATLMVVGRSVVASEASDHLPVVVELEPAV